MKFSERLKQYRKAKGLTQNKLAEMIDVPVSSYREWERGRVINKVEAYSRIAEALGVTLSDLMTGAKSDKKGLLQEISLIERHAELLKVKLMSFL